MFKSRYEVRWSEHKTAVVEAVSKSEALTKILESEDIVSSTMQYEVKSVEEIRDDEK